MQGGGSTDITGIRSLGNRVLGGIVNIMFGTSYTDLCYGYNAFWRRCLPQLHVTCDGFEVETIINVRAAKAGFSIVEVPSYERDRIHGLSNLNAWRDGRRVLKAIVRERFSKLPSRVMPGGRSTTRSNSSSTRPSSPMILRRLATSSVIAASRAAGCSFGHEAVCGSTGVTTSRLARVIRAAGCGPSPCESDGDRAA